MARPLRPDTPGLVHHVVNRGNEKRVIFTDDRDRRLFLEELLEVRDRQEWRVLDYCLMPTHFHLLLECPHAGLSTGMQRLEAAFARRWHARREATGHLFGGRFKSTVVGSDEYLLMALAYIARNPVKDGLCAAAGDWRWSGHRALVHGVSDGLVAVERVHALLTGAGVDGHGRYLHLLDANPSAVPAPVAVPARPPLAELLRDGSDRALGRAHRVHGYGVRAIAEVLGCSPSTVSRRLRAA